MVSMHYLRRSEWPLCILTWWNQIIKVLSCILILSLLHTGYTSFVYFILHPFVHMIGASFVSI